MQHSKYERAEKKSSVTSQRDHETLCENYLHSQQMEMALVHRECRMAGSELVEEVKPDSFLEGVSSRKEVTKHD